MYPPAIQPSGPRAPWARATSRPQRRQIAIVSAASTSVTSAVSSRAGIRRAMKWGSNGTSVFVVVVEALRRWVPLQPFAVPLDIFLVARARAQFADPGVEKQPPFEVTRLQENRVLKDEVERRSGDTEPHHSLVPALSLTADRPCHLQRLA